MSNINNKIKSYYESKEEATTRLFEKYSNIVNKMLSAQYVVGDIIEFIYDHKCYELDVINSLVNFSIFESTSIESIANFVENTDAYIVAEDASKNPHFGAIIIANLYGIDINQAKQQYTLIDELKFGKFVNTNLTTNILNPDEIDVDVFDEAILHYDKKTDTLIAFSREKYFEIVDECQSILDKLYA